MTYFQFETEETKGIIIGLAKKDVKKIHNYLLMLCIKTKGFSMSETMKKQSR